MHHVVELTIVLILVISLVFIRNGWWSIPVLAANAICVGYGVASIGRDWRKRRAL